MTLGFKQNNPTNIIDNDVDYKGKIDSNNAFAAFDTMSNGIRAYFMNYAHQALHNNSMSIREFITLFAPPSENNTEQYILNVCSRTGLTEDQQIPRDKDGMILFFRAQALQEIGTDAQLIDDHDIEKAFSDFSMSVNGFLVFLNSVSPVSISFSRFLVAIFVIIFLIYYSLKNGSIFR